ncbi:MAG TPA: hypothetical protein VI873_03640, partial [Candidatus Peribacteraceae bacterium]|nr:hypothetical protein [Candidatus Peribacteraceae bacterium]
PQNGVAYQQIAAEVLEVMTEVKRTFIQKLRGISPPEGSTFGLIHPETKKVERIIAKVVAHFRGMLLWRTDGEPLDEDVVQSVIPGHDKQILRFLDATVSMIESDSPIKQVRENQWGRPVLKRECMEQAFIHMKFPRIWDEQSVEKHFTDAQNGRPVMEQCESYAQMGVGLDRMWRDLCLMADFNHPLKPIRLSITEENSAMRIVRSDKDYQWEFPQNGGNRIALSSHSSSPIDEVRTNKKEFGDRRLCQHWLHGSMAAILMKFAPHTNFIKFGLVAAAVDLQKDVYEDKSGPQNWSVLYGHPEPGFNIGHDQMSPLNDFEDIQRRMSRVAFAQILGDTTEERIDTFQRIIKVTTKKFQKYDEMREPIHSFSVGEWFKEMEKLAPGFQKRFESHPFSHEPQAGDQTILLTIDRDHEERDPWGEVHSYHFVPNPQCGWVDAEMYRNIEPRIENMDFSLGTYKPHQITARLRQGEEIFHEMREMGSFHFGPVELSKNVTDSTLEKLIHPFAMDVQLPNGTWKCIGTEYRFTRRDQTHLEVNLLESGVATSLEDFQRKQQLIAKIGKLLDEKEAEGEAETCE